MQPVPSQFLWNLEATILTFPPSFSTNSEPPTVVLFSLMLFSPPRTTILPSTLTPSSVTSPSPIPLSQVKVACYLDVPEGYILGIDQQALASILGICTFGRNDTVEDVINDLQSFCSCKAFFRFIVAAGNPAM